MPQSSMAKLIHTRVPAQSDKEAFPSSCYALLEESALTTSSALQAKEHGILDTLRAVMHSDKAPSAAGEETLSMPPGVEMELF